MKDLEEIIEEPQGRMYTIQPVLWVALIMIIIMSGYELIKEFFFPELSKWESHTITIIFTSIIATIIGLLIIKKFSSLQKSLIDELKFRSKVEEKIQILNYELEEEIIRRTKELNEINEQLEKSLSDEKLLSELRIRTINLISHEYKSPLTVIANSAEIIDIYLYQKEYDKIYTPLNNIKTSISVLNTMIDDVLTFRLADDEKVHYEPTELIEFIKNKIEEMKIIDIGGHSFTFDTKVEKINILTDKKYIHLILSNLLINAMKFSPDKSTIYLKINENEHDIIIEIKDEGIGISEEDMNQLFQPFFKSKSHVGIESGTGLGLAISKKLTEQLHGVIHCESLLSKGTTFTIRLPKNIPPEINNLS